MPKYIYTVNGKLIESFDNLFPHPLIDIIMQNPEKERKYICENKFEDYYYYQSKKNYDPSENIVCPKECIGEIKSDMNPQNPIVWMQRNCSDVCKTNCKTRDIN